MPIDVFMALVLLDTHSKIKEYETKAPIKSLSHKIGKICPVTDGQIHSFQ